MAMKNFPSGDISFQLAGPQAVRAAFFTGLGQVHDGDEDAAGDDPALGVLEKVALQVVAHRNEVPPGWLDLEFVFFKIGDERIDLQATFLRANLQNFDSCIGRVDSRDFPAVIRKPESISSRSASKVEGLAGRQLGRGFDEEGRGRGVQVFRGALAKAVAFIPIVNFHGVHRFDIVARLFRGEDFSLMVKRPRI